METLKSIKTLDLRFSVLVLATPLALKRFATLAAVDTSHVVRVDLFLCLKFFAVS